MKLKLKLNLGREWPEQLQNKQDQVVECGNDTTCKLLVAQGLAEVVPESGPAPEKPKPKPKPRKVQVEADKDEPSPPPAKD